MNSFQLDGVAVKTERKAEVVFLRLVHKESFFNKKTKEWEKKEFFITISLFGKTADAAEREIEVGDRLIVEGDINVFPIDGPLSRVRLNGKNFFLLMPYAQKSSPGGESDE